MDRWSAGVLATAGCRRLVPGESQRGGPSPQNSGVHRNRSIPRGCARPPVHQVATGAGCRIRKRGDGIGGPVSLVTVTGAIHAGQELGPLPWRHENTPSAVDDTTPFIMSLSNQFQLPAARSMPLRRRSSVWECHIDLRLILRCRILSRSSGQGSAPRSLLYS